MSLRSPGKVTNPAAGTPLQIYAGNPLLKGREITIVALLTNTKNVYIGDRNLNVGTGAGLRSTLAAGQADTIAAPGPGARANPEEIWWDSDVTGEGITWSID